MTVITLDKVPKYRTDITTDGKGNTIKTTMKKDEINPGFYVDGKRVDDKTYARAAMVANMSDKEIEEYKKILSAQQRR
jgi:hypothetical protein